jgi:ABC-type antimicrobial peptide transport system permease subunit
MRAGVHKVHEEEERKIRKKKKSIVNFFSLGLFILLCVLAFNFAPFVLKI